MSTPSTKDIYSYYLKKNGNITQQQLARHFKCSAALVRKAIETSLQSAPKRNKPIPNFPGGDSGCSIEDLSRSRKAFFSKWVKEKKLTADEVALLEEKLINIFGEQFYIPFARMADIVQLIIWNDMIQILETGYEYLKEELQNKGHISNDQIIKFIKANILNQLTSNY